MQTSQPTTGSGRPSAESAPMMVGSKGSMRASRSTSTGSVRPTPEPPCGPPTGSVLPTAPLHSGQLVWSAAL